MTTSVIDFSAQFGGRDAAAAVLPHFKALKIASSELRLAGFPFAKLAYILRVDGEVNEYGISGAGNIEFDSNGDCLSIDIGIMYIDRDRILSVICDAIQSSIVQIVRLGKDRMWNVDANELTFCSMEIIARYRNELIDHIRRPDAN